MSALQLRGHCQRCGRQQAVPNGHISQHGYDVKKYGYFVGVCAGHRHPPMEVARDEADRVIAAVRADAINQRQNADKLRSGVLKPSMVRGRFDVAVRDYQTIPFADAAPHFQAEAVKLAIYQADGRARAADAFADGHSKLCDAVHGLALKQVQKPEAPPPINVGNKRKLPNGRMAEASSVRGAMVRWQDEKGFVGRSSSRAWRGFAAADPTA